MEKLKKIVKVIDTDLPKCQLYYLDFEEDIIDVPKIKSDIRDMKIDTIINDKDHKVEIQLNKDKLESFNWGSSPMSRTTSPTTISPLKMLSKNIHLNKEYMSELSVFNELKKSLFKLGDETTNNFKTPLIIDLNLDIKKNMINLVRASSLIAMGGRIGPSQFILMNRQMISHFSAYITNTDGIMSMNGLEIIIDPTISDKTIVGRINEKDQPGVKMVTNGVKYSIEHIGNKCAQQYVSITVKY